MRYIDKRQLPRLADLRAINTANIEISKLPENERKAFLDSKENQKLWSNLKAKLWKLGNMKCWYSEAKLKVAEGHVEHFRPKNTPHGLNGEKHCGYWWRAFDWDNYRLAHPDCNLRRKDYLTGNMLGKGAYFPLKDGDIRATCKAEESGEHPVLLDPTNPSDCKLISFDTNDGTPVPAFSFDEDSWRHQRAKESIDYYHLNEGTWNCDRKDLIDEVGILCDRLLEEESSPNRDIDKCDELTDELVGYIDEHKPFTAACMQVIREKGLLEVVV